MSAFQPIHGQCECARVRYRVVGPAEELYHCHCLRCRRLHGALFATFAVVAREHLVIERGSGALSTYTSPHGEWHFCRHCGCHLLVDSDKRPDAVWYMAATLDGDASPGHPQDTEKHIFVASKSALATITDSLPQYAGYAPEGEAGSSKEP